jgi:hypothetical protein
LNGLPEERLKRVCASVEEALPRLKAGAFERRDGDPDDRVPETSDLEAVHCGGGHERVGSEGAEGSGRVRAEVVPHGLDDTADDSSLRSRPTAGAARTPPAASTPTSSS